MDSGQTIEKVFFLKENFGQRLAEIREGLKKSKIPFSIVPKVKFKGIGKKNHQGIVALISPILYRSLDNLLDSIFTAGKDPFLLVTDSVTDVRNIGAIARSAQAFGCHGLLIPVKGGALLNSDAIKASSGALFELPVCRLDSLVGALKELKNSGLRVISITEKSEEKLWDADLKGPIVLVLGSKGK